MLYYISLIELVTIAKRMVNELLGIKGINLKHYKLACEGYLAVHKNGVDISHFVGFVKEFAEVFIIMTDFYDDYDNMLNGYRMYFEKLVEYMVAEQELRLPECETCLHSYATGGYVFCSVKSVEVGREDSEGGFTIRAKGHCPHYEQEIPF